MTFLTLPWGRLAYSDTGGAGVPLLFLHGTGCDSADWAGVFAALPKARRVIAMDFRAHGESDRPTGAFTLADLASDVLALLDHLALRRVVLVGHSLGGMVAMPVASRTPVVTGLVLLEGWTTLTAAGRAFKGTRFYGALPAARADTIRTKAEATRLRIVRPDWDQFWTSVQQADATAFLESTRIPILEVYGSMGRTDQTAALRGVPARPEIEWVWVEGAGHYLPHEVPAAVAAACERGLERAAAR